MHPARTNPPTMPAGPMPRVWNPADGVAVDCQIFATYTLQPDGSVVVTADLRFDSDFVVNEDMLTDEQVDALPAIIAAAQGPRAMPVTALAPTDQKDAWRLTGTRYVTKETDPS